MDTDDDRTWVSVGDVCRRRLNMQCQYGSRCLTGVAGYPRFGDDLRWHGGDPDSLFRQDPPDGNYHALRIHHEDVDVFVTRVLDHRRSTGQIA